MKMIKTSLLALTVLATGLVQAQNKNNPWAISFGVNSVDVRTEGDYPWRSGLDFGGIMKDGFGNFKDNSVLPAISKLSVARYIGRGFSAELEGTLNKLEEGFGGKQIDETFWAVNLQGRYALRNIFTTENGWFDPYVKAGGGFSSLNKDDVKALAGLGINFWLNDNIGLNIQTGYHHHFKSTGTDYFQHSAGIVIQFGGSPDRDKDGIPDKDDKCPDVPGVKENNGCPEVKPEPAPVVEEPKPVVEEPKFDDNAQKVLNDIAKAVLFDTAKATIKPESFSVLDEIVTFFNKYKNSRFTVEGHTDSQGNKVSNQKLSERRAQAVKDYLISKGVDASRLESRGYGQEKPIATNKTAEGRKLNRRTEINLIK